ncbi:NUDIX hydrolase [Pseudooceanicola onchidii]|uniref:NUDIX hydrolase n=1 Tax=Pseudooceanicola onchidii TaxID=2562279 RepID=UPI0010AB208B|nr:NUDIX hydrolase [Pseudooceanicola onchidii]
MMHYFKSAWSGYVQPMLQRPKRLQVAALCFRGSGDTTQVLLVTSRGTGRWIIPKGWPMTGKTSAEAALQEAWEEAGVEGGTCNGRIMGSYTYEKRKKDGWSMTVETLVYAVAVDDVCDSYPEADQRRRTWVTPQQAATMVDEPELQQILMAFDPDNIPG